MSLPPWRPLLRGARQREGRSPQARWLQLATLGSDGAPRVRTLVFRGWAGPAELDLLTDSRSGKASELIAQPRLELCWLLPKARSQFRLRGRRFELPPEGSRTPASSTGSSSTPAPAPSGAGRSLVRHSMPAPPSRPSCRTAHPYRRASPCCASP
jgi:PPOX class probable FMN-dependent enzyme